MPRLPKSTEKLLQKLEQRPRDPRLLQKIAELYQKWGEPKAAAASFNQLAQVYEHEGLGLKAAAVAKQVLKLDPAMVSTRVFLAALYERIDLVSEAAAEYKLALDQFQAAGDAKNAALTMDALARLQSGTGEDSKD